METKDYFYQVRDIPYKIPMEFDEPDYTCSGKHTELRDLLTNAGMNVRYRYADFEWNRLLQNAPKSVKKEITENEACHLYLQFEKKKNLWLPIDATFDSGLAKVLPVNEWDGKSRTNLSVVPTHNYQAKKSADMYIEDNADWTIEDFKEDIKENRNFYKAMNDWFAWVRKKN